MKIAEVSELLICVSVITSMYIMVSLRCFVV